MWHQMFFEEMENDSPQHNDCAVLHGHSSGVRDLHWSGVTPDLDRDGGVMSKKDWDNFAEKFEKHLEDRDLSAEWYEKFEELLAERNRAYHKWRIECAQALKERDQGTVQ